MSGAPPWGRFPLTRKNLHKKNEHDKPGVSSSRDKRKKTIKCLS